MGIQDKLFTYIDKKEDLTMSMVQQYKNSMIVLGDEQIAFVPAINSYIGGIGVSAYNDIMHLIRMFGNIDIIGHFTEEDHDYYINMAFAAVDGAQTSYLTNSLIYNPHTKVLTTDTFCGYLSGYSYQTQYLRTPVSLWGNTFYGNNDIEGNIIPSDNDVQTLGDQNNYFAYSYINHMIGYLHGNAETSSYAEYTAQSYQLWINRVNNLSNYVYFPTFISHERLNPNNVEKFSYLFASDNRNIYIFDKEDPGNYKEFHTIDSILSNSTFIEDYILDCKQVIQSPLLYFTYSDNLGILMNSLFKGNLIGTSSYSYLLYTPRLINGTYFDGSEDITTVYWGAQRNVTIADYYDTYTYLNSDIDGGDDFTLHLPEYIHADLHGTADMASYAFTADISNRSYMHSQNQVFDDKEYLIPFSSNSFDFAYSYISNDFYYNPSTSTVTATYFNGIFKGTANDAIQLTYERKINGTYFDGTHDITTTYWGHPRDITIADYYFTYTYLNSDIDGGDDFTLYLPEYIHADLCGTADMASYAFNADLADRAYKTKLNLVSTVSNYYIRLSNTSNTSFAYTYIDNGFYWNPTDGGVLVSTYFMGWVRGVADDAVKLQIERKINGTYFDGTQDITTTYWGYERIFQLSDYNSTYTGDQTRVHGDQDITLKLPQVVNLDICGNATFATTSELANRAYKHKQVLTSNSDPYFFQFTNNTGLEYSYTYTNGNLIYIPSSNRIQASYFEGWLDGIADDAIKLYFERKINGTYFNGTQDITTTYWGYERIFKISDYHSTYEGPTQAVHGDSDITLKLPSNIHADLHGNADTATWASSTLLANQVYKSSIRIADGNLTYYITMSNVTSGFSYTYAHSELQYNPSTEELTTTYLCATKLFRGKLRASDQWGIL